MAKSRLLLSLVVLAYLAVAFCVVQVPIRSSGNGLSRVLQEGRLAEFHQQRAKFNRLRNATGEVVEPQNDYRDMRWTGEITVGTPGQKFNMCFDTGSGIAWIPGSVCTPTVQTPHSIPHFDCSKQTRLNEAASKTFNRSDETFMYRYMAGGVGGNYAEDTIKFGAGPHQIALANAKFGLANYFQLNCDAVPCPYDGILGLALSNPTENFTPLFVSAYERKQVGHPVFTVYMKSDVHNWDFSRNVDGGVITFGGMDEVNCGEEIGRVDVGEKAAEIGLWGFVLDSVSIGQSTYEVNDTVLTDTGGFLAAGPAVIVDAIAKAAGAKDVGVGGESFWTIPCNATYAPITFTINGQNYGITSKVLNIDVLNDPKNPNVCFFGLQSWPFGWYLGDVFFRQFCVIHDVGKKQMGFAKQLKK